MKTLLFGLLVSLLPISAFAADPARELQALKPGQWLSYEVPLQPGLRAPCCIRWNAGRVRGEACRLEDNEWNHAHRDSDAPPVGDERLSVYLRRGATGTDRVLAVGSDCPIEAGSETLIALGPVDERASLGLLEPLLERRSERVSHAAVMAIAHHAGDPADTVLERASKSPSKASLRRDAVFWLAQARGEPGFRAVRDLLQTETDRSLCRHAVFALSISKVPAARTELRGRAREDVRDDVRGEAIFWLAQQDDAEAEAIIFSALEGEPADMILEKAVFALSQLPPERAVPALRELIERGTSRELRKKALFWLAQVDDEAALPVLDALLGGKP